MARSFNGTSDFASSALVSNALDNVSWGGWFWAATMPQTNAIPFFNGNEGSNGYGINIFGSIYQLFLGGINFFNLFNPSPLQWYHTLFVRRAGQWVGYLNGVPTNLTTTAPNAPTGGTSFGSDAGHSGRFFAGNLAEWAFWNVPLTDQEAAELALGRRPKSTRPGSLLAYWPMFGLGTAEPDLSNNGFGLTLTGTAFAPHAPVTLFTKVGWVNVQVILPQAPTNLVATGAVGSVGLTWNSSTPAPVTYSIYRGLTPGSETLYDNGISPTSYIDGNVLPGVTYYYKVSATDPGGEGALSAEASAVAGVPAPTGLTGVGVVGHAVLTWNSVANVTGYKVYRNGSLIATVSGTSFTDNSPIPNLLNVYTVTAYVVSTGTVESAQSSGVLVAGPEFPATPGPEIYFLDSLTSSFFGCDSLVHGRPGPVPPTPPFPFPLNPPTVITGEGSNQTFIEGTTEPG